MAADDFYTYSAKHRLAQISAERAQWLANLEQAKASSDYEIGAQAEQAIANIDAETRNLHALHNQYVASQTPVQPPEPTQEEIAARPISAMDYSDVWRMSQNSKYGVDENAFRAGMAEVLRRRQQGG
jgi:hypothetical protein